MWSRVECTKYGSRSGVESPLGMIHAQTRGRARTRVALGCGAALGREPQSDAKRLPCGRPIDVWLLVPAFAGAAELLKQLFGAGNDGLGAGL